MKSTPESLREFCKFFTDPDWSKESRFIEELKNGKTSKWDFRTTWIPSYVRAFNDGEKLHTGRVNPDPNVYHIYEGDMDELVDIYYASLTDTDSK